MKTSGLPSFLLVALIPEDIKSQPKSKVELTSHAWKTHCRFFWDSFLGMVNLPFIPPLPFTSTALKLSSCLLVLETMSQEAPNTNYSQQQPLMCLFKAYADAKKCPEKRVVSSAFGLRQKITGTRQLSCLFT